MTKCELKKEVCTAIDDHREDILSIGRSVFLNPEMGYKEYRTSELVKNVFSLLSIEYCDGLAITGVKATLKGRNNLCKAAVLGEMDAILCPMHPRSDKITGAAHACGHNAQIAAMLGVAMGFVKSGGMKYLDGDISFMAVPAEEFAELEFRQGLKESGKIGFLGGKQELIRLGAFDDIDMAMMVHCQADTPACNVFIHGRSTGFIGKMVRIIGKEAHAGAAPHEGVNALNAAMAALMCINAQRETFRDEDHIRVHPIITKGGDLVNIVPADVRMETYVRGKSIDAVLDANRKVNMAIRGGVYAIGAEAEITELPGYLPLNQDSGMGEFFKSNVAELEGVGSIEEGIDMFGSTDIGDLSSIIPVIQPTMGGYKGQAHSRDFQIANEEAAYILPAKAMAMTIIDLLWNGAEEAVKIKQSYQPQFTRETYLNLWERLIGSEKPEGIH